MSDDQQQQQRGVEPERRKIYDIEEEPDKNFWNEIRSRHELKHRDYSHLPNSLEEIRESDKYEIEPLFAASTIRHLWKDDFKKCIKGEADELRERGEEDVAEQLEHLAERFEEVFSSK